MGNTSMRISKFISWVLTLVLAPATATGAAPAVADPNAPATIRVQFAFGASIAKSFGNPANAAAEEAAIRAVLIAALDEHVKYWRYVPRPDGDKPSDRELTAWVTIEAGAPHLIVKWTSGGIVYPVWNEPILPPILRDGRDDYRKAVEAWLPVLLRQAKTRKALLDRLKDDVELSKVADPPAQGSPRRTVVRVVPRFEGALLNCAIRVKLVYQDTDVLVVSKPTGPRPMNDGSQGVEIVHQRLLLDGRLADIDESQERRLSAAKFEKCHLFSEDFDRVLIRAYTVD
jgi:hypothetical protein